MRQIIGTLERVAVSDLGILIVGEAGTGKNWLARMIHSLSGRATRPITAVDCAALDGERGERSLFGWEETGLRGTSVATGLIEDASGGTILFDRISALNTSLQLRIVRTFEHHHYRRVGGYHYVPLNARAIATVRKKFGEVGHEGEVGKEIYHRFCPVMINLPPLRERRGDISFLIEQFIFSAVPAANRPKGITGDALTLCMKYHWPGNTRQLKGVIASAAAHCSDEFIGRDHLSAHLEKEEMTKPGVTAGSSPD